MEKTAIQKKRALLFYGGTSALFVVVGLVLFWYLRPLLLPSIIGALSAYICIPLLNFLKRQNIPRWMGIIILFLIFVGAIFFLARQIQNIIPDENGKTEFRVRVQYKLNEKYRSLMGIDSTGEKGNFIYNLAGKELNPIMDNINELLFLDEEEKQAYNASSEKFFDYYVANAKMMASHVEDLKKEGKEDVLVEELPEEEGESKISAFLGILSLWLVMPFVFLFLLIDDGQIKKNLVYLIPNKYFEMVLTVWDNVDEAIGNYLRGTILECSLVGLTIGVGLFVVGVELKWALIIGSVAGAANAIPFLGPVIGLVVGLAYALVAEDANALLPFFNADNMVIGVLISVGVAQAMDNAVFQPVVLGNAVNLHPLIVIFGVMGGSLLFGFVGMLFAIPTIVIFKEIFATLYTQLRAYYII